MGRAPSEWLRNLGFDRIASMRKWNITFVIRKVAMDFLRLARLKEMLVIGGHTAKLLADDLEFRTENQFHDG
uniref:Acyl-CoA thioester hydrolase n=1 Tax=Candidatus Kentrum sp. TC TaxID=2126339 RepID=A0A450ZJ45_9GAMM|nr:MAG: acyl-CoA thioester hydrolase [Candidatus Kentron sp. TC]